jgi:hypothetical protein
MTDNSNAREQLAALIKQGAAIMVDAADIDAKIDQLKRSSYSLCWETITKSPAPPARASRSPTRGPITPPSPPRTASNSPPPPTNPAIMAENNSAEEWLIAYAARIDAQINQQKKGVIGTITRPPGPLARAGESPTREPTTSAPPPRTAHGSPQPSRTANHSPTTRRESRPLSPEKRPTYRLKTPSDYKLENWTTRRDADYACKLNKHWKENINPQSKRMLLLNTLFSSEKLRSIEEPYEREIYFSYIRDSAHHPFYREPYDEDELSLWTRNTTSIDTLHSRMLPCHPTRFTHLHVFSCTSKDWLVPVISDHIKANTLAKYLSAKLEPFYAEGKGDIICPVCITYIRGETF